MLLPNLHAGFAIKLELVLVIRAVSFHANVVYYIIASAFAFIKIISFVPPLGILLNVCRICGLHQLVNIIRLILWHEVIVLRVILHL